jgi:hypothetical protein
MSVSAATVSSAVSLMALFKLANGEYSASSVATDPSAANKLQLMKLQDGNYGSLQFFGPSALASAPAYRSTSSVQSALNSLTLGG